MKRTLPIKILFFRVFLFFVFIIVIAYFFNLITLVNANDPIGISPNMTIQGKLVNNDGTNIPVGACNGGGKCDFMFKLFNAETGGVQLWESSEYSSVSVIDGIFNIRVDFDSAKELFKYKNLWLEVLIDMNNDGDFTDSDDIFGRMQLTSVPYAFNARYINGIDPETGFILAGPTNTQNIFSVDPLIYLNQTGGGGLLTLQEGGLDRFVIHNEGDIDIGVPSHTVLMVLNGIFSILEGGDNPFYYTDFVGGDQSYSITYTLPVNSNNGILTNTDGILSWESPSGLPSGNDGQTLFYDGVSSSWLASSLLFNNGSYIGIGDTTPNYLFTVGDGDLFGVDGYGRVYHPMGYADTPSIAFKESPMTGLFLYNYDVLGFSTIGSLRMIIDSIGNVGIGTSNPIYNLSVEGTLGPGSNVRDGSGHGGIDFYDSGMGYQYAAKIYTFKDDYYNEYYGLTQDYDNSSSQLSLVAQHSNGSIGFYTGDYPSSQRMIINSIGNVGIGTSNPIYNLSVEGTLGPGSNVRDGSGHGGIDFYDNGIGYQYAAKIYTFKDDYYNEYYGLTQNYDNSSSQLSLVAQHSNGSIGFYTGDYPSSQRMIINSIGNVGIGTSNIYQKLTVAGNLLSSYNEGYLSTGNMLLSQLEGGGYFGRVGIKENQWRLSNYGNTWVAKESNRQWIGVAMSSDGKIQTAVVNGGQIYVSLDYGNTWVAKESNRAWIGVAMSSDGKIQTAVVNGGQIYVSLDYGNTWVAKESNRAWIGVAMSSDGKIQTAVVYGGQIYVSLDYGNTWVAKESNRQWQGVAMSSDGKIQTAVVYGGQIYVSNADSYIEGNVGIGTSNIYQKLTVAGNLLSSYNEGYLSTGNMLLSQLEGGGYFGRVGIKENQWRLSNYGNTWVAKGSDGNWRGVAMSSDGKIQTAVVNGGQIYVSLDYGNTWVAKESNRNWRGVAMSSDGKIQTAVVNGGQIYVSLDYGNTWVAKESNRNWRGVAMSSDGKIQTAVVYGGQIYVSNADSYIEGTVGIGSSSFTSPENIPTGSLFISNGSLCVDNGGDNCDDSSRTAGTIYANSTSIGSMDIAEIYLSDDELVPGQIVDIDIDKAEHVKLSEYDSSRLLGVVSTYPGVTLGGFSDLDGYKIALNGKVPVIAVRFKDDINIGDIITSSILSGLGEKISDTGFGIGKSLDSTSNWNDDYCKTVENLDDIEWPYDDGTNSAKPCFKTKVLSLNSDIRDRIKEKYDLIDEDYIYVGKIMVFVNLSWYQSEDQTARLEQMLEDYSNGLLNNSSGAWIIDGSSNTVSTVMDVVSHKFRGTYGVFDIAQVARLEVNGGNVIIDSAGNIMTKGDLTVDRSVVIKQDLIVEGDLTVNGLIKTSNTGSSTLKANQSEVYISNSKVNSSSKILVTPSADTCGKVVYVKSRNNGSGFTVSISGGTCSNDINFDWWIVDQK